MVTLPPSWVPIISDGSQSFSISKLIEQRNHVTVIAMCLVINSDMQWSVHTTRDNLYIISDTTHRQFSTHNCLLLSELPILLNSIDKGFFLCQCVGRKDEGCPAKKTHRNLKA